VDKLKSSSVTPISSSELLEEDSSSDSDENPPGHYSGYSIMFDHKAYNPYDPPIFKYSINLRQDRVRNSKNADESNGSLSSRFS